MSTTARKGVSITTTVSCNCVEKKSTDPWEKRKEKQNRLQWTGSMKNFFYFLGFNCIWMSLDILRTSEELQEEQTFNSNSNTVQQQRCECERKIKAIKSTIYPNSKWPPGRAYFPAPLDPFLRPTSTQLGWSALRTNTPTPTFGRSLLSKHVAMME